MFVPNVTGKMFTISTRSVTAGNTKAAGNGACRFGGYFWDSIPFLLFPREADCDKGTI